MLVPQITQRNDNSLTSRREAVSPVFILITLKMNNMKVDVLVCGGGMSGMACAAAAAEAGARVLVVEKQPHLGGSSIYSAGML